MKALSFGYVIAGIGFYTAMAVGFLYMAGSFELPFFYGVYGAYMLVSVVGALCLSPELLAERVKPKGKDKDPIGSYVMGTLWITQLSLAAMDVGHWHMSDKVPAAVQVITLLIMTVAWFGCLWAMQANFFFSSAIRLQEDRGQEVVAGGPYAWMRHPGYAFASVGFLSEGVALGSWMTLIPAVLMVSYLLYRTTLEEKMLHPGLTGYKEYAAKVPFKWIPGLW